jgi:hypothetical protein
MRRVFFSILAAGLLMTAVCNGASVMTMTTSSDNVKIYLAGSGTVTIDWGDGSEIVTSALKEYKSRWFHIKNEYSYGYTSESSRTITITGENITHIGCNGKLTNLDVSQNTELTYLECRFCQLTSLDVSKNTKLSRLICQGNQLTSLDVSNNTVLTGLDCSMNMLKNLDVSNNTALTRLSYACNPNYTPFDSYNTDTYADALDNLFGTLNSNAGKKIIMISGQSGKAVSCDKSIAEKKGWKITEVKFDESPKTGKKKVFIPDIV